MKKIEKIENFLSELSTDVDILNCIDVDEIDTSDAYYSIYEMIQENGGFDIDIIYYSRAIEYLSENDPSLQESLGIASEYGFSVDSLNSETLASLLASRDIQDAFSELEDEINDFFEELEDIYFCEECDKEHETEEAEECDHVQ